MIHPSAQPFVQQTQSQQPQHFAASPAPSRIPVQPYQQAVSVPATQDEKNLKKNEKRKQRKQRKRQQEAEASKKLGAPSNGTSSKGTSSHNPSVSNVPDQARIRVTTRGRAKPQPKTQQAAVIPSPKIQKQPEQKVEIVSRKEKDNLAGDKSRAKQFKKTHPGVAAPSRLSKQDFKQLKKIHGEGI